MFNLFKKKIINCEKCSKLLRQYHIFDPTCGGSYFGLKKLKLCTSCMIEEYKKHLNTFQNKAIFIEPLKNYVAYPYYTFKEILTNDYWPKESVKELQDFINQNGKCVKCGKDTKFLLCSPEIYQNNPLKSFDIKNDNCSKKYLCADCLCNHFEKIIHRNNLHFNTIYPPKGGDGVSTSFNP